MTDIIHYQIEVSVSLLCFYLVYIFLFQKEKTFRFNRVYLLASILLSFSMPWIHISPIVTIDILDINTITMDTLQIGGTQIQSNTQNTNWWAIGYLSFTAFLLAKIINTSYSILSIKGEISTLAGTQYTSVKGGVTAFSFLTKIYLGDQIDENQKVEILMHEKHHVEEYHSLDIITMEFLIALCWINPLLYLYKKLIIENHEYIADHAVSKHSSTTQYVKTLANYTLQNMGYNMVSSFSKPMINKRINMLNKPNKQMMKIKYLVPVVIATLLFTAISCRESVVSPSMSNLPQTIEFDDGAFEISDEVDGIVFDIVEDQPSPINGMKEFYKWVRNNLKYPTASKKAGIEGKVFVQFIVDTQGQLTDIKIVKGLDDACDQEVVRLIRQAADWNPGKQKGRLVNVRMVLPISFNIG